MIPYTSRFLLHPFSFPFHLHPTLLCWHGICNVMIRGEHMSYKEPIIVNRQQWERQQEKLRIARKALAQVEAKYVRKGHVKPAIQGPEDERATASR
jgi:hypothetical protein